MGHDNDTFTCLDCRQVNDMRFSSVFQLQQPQRLAPEAPAAMRVLETEPAAMLPPAAEPPDDLDQRVRLVGEWQLGLE